MSSVPRRPISSGGGDRQVRRGPVDQPSLVRAAGLTTFCSGRRCTATEPTATAALFDVFEQFRRHPRRAGIPRSFSTRSPSMPVRCSTRTAPSASSAARPGHRHQTGTPCGCRRPRDARIKSLRDRLNARSASICTTRAGAPLPARRGSRPPFHCCRSRSHEARTESLAAS